MNEKDEEEGQVPEVYHGPSLIIVKVEERITEIQHHSGEVERKAITCCSLRAHLQCTVPGVIALDSVKATIRAHTSSIAYHIAA
jgi:hypothetical protein